MNKIIIKGRLTRDPELKTAGTGTEYCNMTVAVDSFNGKEKETDFFDCTAFGNTGSAISKYMTKGREILVEGRMESNMSEKDGQKRTFWGVTAAYTMYYVCRMTLGVVKQPIIDGGVLTAGELGVIGSVFYFVYAAGKFTNGFIADYCNIRRFMAPW